MSKWKLSIPLLLIIFLLPNISYGALTVTTSTIDSNTIRIHIVADSWADVINDVSDCGGSGSGGEWAFILHKSGTDYQSTINIQEKTTLDVTEDITLAANGTYKLGILFGSHATSWTNLYNVTYSGTAGGSTFSGTVDNYKQITIPLPVPSPTPSPTTYYTTFMSSSTDIAVNYFFLYATYFIDFLFILTIAGLVYWFYNRTD